MCMLRVYRVYEIWVCTGDFQNNGISLKLKVVTLHQEL